MKWDHLREKQSYQPDGYPYDIKLSLREFEADRFRQFEDAFRSDTAIVEVAFMYKSRDLCNMELTLPVKCKNRYP